MGPASLMSGLAMNTLAASSITPTGDAQSEAPIDQHVQMMV